MTAVIVGIGQDAAGDDAVGLAVARALAARGVLARECADASVVLELLAAGHRVVIVDAVVGHTPGEIIELGFGVRDALVTGPAPLSSHGLGVAEALELARVLYGDHALDRVALVAIAIERPAPGRIGLSSVAAATVELAAARALALRDGFTS